MSIWKNFGFNKTPYLTEPLKPNAEGNDLFAGRAEQAESFLSQIDRDDGCVVVISGDSGIGKTSFFNVQQFRIVTRNAGIELALLPCYFPTSVLKGDDERSLAKRIMENVLSSIGQYCEERRRKVPQGIKELKDWMSHKPDENGFSLDLAGFGASRSFSITNVADVSLESWLSIFRSVSEECYKNLGVDGLFACIDNAEGVESERLMRFFMAYRDTLFSLQRVWWVIIGQSHLFGQVLRDPRLGERIQGSGIEIPPMTGAELHELVEKRIRKYRSDLIALNPLSERIHQHLYDASRGVARFVLKTADDLVIDIVAATKAEVRTRMANAAAPNAIEQAVDNALQDRLFHKRIPDDIATHGLCRLSVNRLSALYVTADETTALEKIGLSHVSAEQYAEFGKESAEQFQSEILDRLTDINLLQRRAVRGRIQYRLRGFAYLCADLNGFAMLRTRISSRDCD